MNTNKKITLWIFSVIVSVLVFWILESIITATFKKALIRSLSHENSFGGIEVGPAILPHALVYCASSLFAFLVFYRIAPVVGKTAAKYTFLFVGILGFLPILIDVIQLGDLSGLASSWCWKNALFMYNTLFGITLGCFVSFLAQPKPTQEEISRYLQKS